MILLREMGKYSYISFCLVDEQEKRGALQKFLRDTTLGLEQPVLPFGTQT